MRIFLGICFVWIVFSCQRDRNSVEESAGMTPQMINQEASPYFISIDATHNRFLPFLHQAILRGIANTESFFNRTFRDRFRVHLHDDRSQFEREYGAPVPWCIEGFARRDVVHLLSPLAHLGQPCVPGWKDTSFSDFRQDIRTVNDFAVLIDDMISHELIHVFHSQQTSGMRPDSTMLWYEEGLATYASGQLDYYWGPKVYDYAIQHQFGLSDLRRCDYYYALSASLTAYIDHRFGRTVLYDLLFIKSSSELIEHVKLSETELIHAWKESLKPS